ncbi:MAG: nuclear transport factor 2 family protein [Acidobacteriota bacterium]
MKKLILIAALTIISATFAFAQSKAEQEILKFIADYDQAYINKDVDFAERVWADNYIFSYEGTSQNRAKSLEEARADKADANPKYKFVSYKSVNDSMQIIGNVAIVSGSWTSSIVPTSDLKAEPHIDNGRYTMILEKRNGKWMVIAEHNSEAPHDKKLMEAQVLKMGQEYSEMIKRGDAAEIEKILADDYLYTDEKGKVLNKAEDLATYKDRKSKFELVETTDQKVRIVGNTTAVETGTFHVKGTDKDGKPFDETERYTTTWMARNGQWKIVADHTSSIKK